MTKRLSLPIKKDISAGSSSSAPDGRAPIGPTHTKDRPPAEEPAAGISAGAPLRAVFVVDGFNLFHAIDDLGAPHLKWLNLWALAEKLVESGEVVSQVIWCSARDGNGSKTKFDRHISYQLALESVGVKAILGHFTDAPMKCPTCGPYTKPTEKASDVNVGIYAVTEALTGGADSIYLVTADTDQSATMKFIADNCPEVNLVIVAPPGRRHGQHLLQDADGSRTIEEATVIDCLFPKVVTKGGKFVVNRPANYDLPPGWLKAKAEKAARSNRPVEVEIKKSRKPKLPK